MTIDFDKPTIDEDFTYTPDQLKGNCYKHKGSWTCIAYVEEEERIVVCAIGHGKKMKQVLKEVMTNAVNRSKGVDQ